MKCAAIIITIASYSFIYFKFIHVNHYVNIYSGKLMEAKFREDRQHDIERLIKARNDNAGDELDEWITFFEDKLPALADDGAEFVDRCFEVVLKELSECPSAGAIKYAAPYESFERDKLTASYWVDPITFKKGNMSGGERKKILTKLKKQWPKLITRIDEVEDYDPDNFDDDTSDGGGDSDSESGGDSNGDSDGDSDRERADDSDCEEDAPHVASKYAPISVSSSKAEKLLPELRQSLVGKNFEDKHKLFVVDSVDYNIDYKCFEGLRRNVSTNRVSSTSFCVHGRDGLLELVDKYANRSLPMMADNSVIASNSEQKKRKQTKHRWYYQEIVSDPDDEQEQQEQHDDHDTQSSSRKHSRRKCAKYTTTSSSITTSKEGNFASV